MKRPSHYEWLLIVEGSTDVGVFKNYLCDNNSSAACYIHHAGGKNLAKNMPIWNQKLLDTLQNDLGKTGFKGVIIIIDSDDDNDNPFDDYIRSDKIQYRGNKPSPYMDSSGSFWHLDDLIGVECIPLRGVNVPFVDSGGLETELLSAHGFPIKGQAEYDSLTKIIKRTTKEWNIPDNNDGNPWWKINETTKMDKFIYIALKEGFTALDKKPKLPDNLDVITRIRKAMIK